MEKLSYGALAPPPAEGGFPIFLKAWPDGTIIFRNAGRREINRQRIGGFTPPPGPGRMNRARRRELTFRGPIDFNMTFHQAAMPVPRTERRKVARQLAKLEARGAV
jgi:hypothetical protein